MNEEMWVWSWKILKVPSRFEMSLCGQNNGLEREMSLCGQKRQRVFADFRNNTYSSSLIVIAYESYIVFSISVKKIFAIFWDAVPKNTGQCISTNVIIYISTDVNIVLFNFDIFHQISFHVWDISGCFNHQLPVWPNPRGDAGAEWQPLQLHSARARRCSEEVGNPGAPICSMD